MASAADDTAVTSALLCVSAALSSSNVSSSSSTIRTLTSAKTLRHVSSASAATSSNSFASSSGCGNQFRTHHRQLHCKRRSSSFAAAPHFYCAAVNLDQVSRNRQSQAESAVLSGRRAVCLAKSIKHIRQKLRRNAWSSVGHFHLDLRISSCEAAPSPCRPWA